MLLSQLEPSKQSRVVVDSFGGYNHNLRIGDGEFYDMENMTSDYYPALASGKAHGDYKIIDEFNPTGRPVNDIKGMTSKGQLCYADGGDLYVGTRVFRNFLSTSEDMQPKRFVSMGAYLIVFPDKKYVNTADLLHDYGDIEASWKSADYVTEEEDDDGHIIVKYPSVTYSLCNIDGDDYTNVPTQKTAPKNPKGGDKWIDTSQSPHSLKIYSSSTSMWTQVATTYIKINAYNIAKDFKELDGVYLNYMLDGAKEVKQGDGLGEVADLDTAIVTMRKSGNSISVHQPNNGTDASGGAESDSVTMTATAYNNSRKTIQELNDKTSVIYKLNHDAEDPSNDYIMVVGFIDSVLYRREEKFIIKREMPVMDYVVESGNRLWGCRYGKSLKDDNVNEIYASKLGDFKNWNVFLGTATDSYVASVGTDGKFTGAVSYNGYPIFFKEDNMHKVFGNYPANYQIQNTPCRGVAYGSNESLAIVGESLLYKTRNGVAIYDGSLPVEISNAFGGTKYSIVESRLSDGGGYAPPNKPWLDGLNSYGGTGASNLEKKNPLAYVPRGAVAGAFGNKYIINMCSEKDNKWYTFTFDLTTNMWFKECEGKIEQFCQSSDELYYTVKDGDAVTGIKKWVDNDNKTPVEWFVESGRIGMNINEKKYISRYEIKMQLDVNTRADVYIDYDSDGKWQHIQTLKGTKLRTVSFPIRPRRCDHFRIKIKGRGDAKIFSITKYIEEGSEK